MIFFSLNLVVHIYILFLLFKIRIKTTPTFSIRDIVLGIKHQLNVVDVRCEMLFSVLYLMHCPKHFSASVCGIPFSWRIFYDSSSTLVFIACLVYSSWLNYLFIACNRLLRNFIVVNMGLRNIVSNIVVYSVVYVIQYSHSWKMFNKKNKISKMYR